MASTPSMDSQSASSAGAASSAQPQYFVDSTKGNIKEVYSFQQKLANGGFGIVYLAEHRESHQKYAIKAIQKKKLKDYTTFINEINILKILVSKQLLPSLYYQEHPAGAPYYRVNHFLNHYACVQDHPNIIKLHEIWEWNDVCFLVLE